MTCRSFNRHKLCYYVGHILLVTEGQCSVVEGSLLKVVWGPENIGSYVVLIKRSGSASEEGEASWTLEFRTTGCDPFIFAWVLLGQNAIATSGYRR